MTLSDKVKRLKNCSSCYYFGSHVTVLPSLLTFSSVLFPRVPDKSYLLQSVFVHLLCVFVIIITSFWAMQFSMSNLFYWINLLDLFVRLVIITLHIFAVLPRFLSTDERNVTHVSSSNSLTKMPRETELFHICLYHFCLG